MIERGGLNVPGGCRSCPSPTAGPECAPRRATRDVCVMDRDVMMRPRACVQSRAIRSRRPTPPASVWRVECSQTLTMRVIPFNTPGDWASAVLRYPPLGHCPRARSSSRPSVTPTRFAARWFVVGSRRRLPARASSTRSGPQSRCWRLPASPSASEKRRSDLRGYWRSSTRTSPSSTSRWSSCARSLDGTRRSRSPSALSRRQGSGERTCQPIRHTPATCRSSGHAFPPRQVGPGRLRACSQRPLAPWSGTPAYGCSAGRSSRRQRGTRMRGWHGSSAPSPT